MALPGLFLGTFTALPGLPGGTERSLRTGSPRPSGKSPSASLVPITKSSSDRKQISTFFKRSNGHRGENQKTSTAQQDIFIKSLSAFITRVQGSISSNTHQQQTGSFHRTLPESSSRKMKRYIICNDSHTTVFSVETSCHSKKV